MRREKTDRLYVRVSPKDKALIMKAGKLSELSSTAETSDIIRDASVLTAENLLKLESGEITMLVALENYKTLLESLLAIDEEGAEVAP